MASRKRYTDSGMSLSFKGRIRYARPTKAHALKDQLDSVGNKVSAGCTFHTLGLSDKEIVARIQDGRISIDFDHLVDAGNVRDVVLDDFETEA